MEFFHAFNEISTDRQVLAGMGGAHYLPIPASSIDRVALDFPGEERAFRQCMRAMDRVYLEIANRDPDTPRLDKSRPFRPGDLSTIGKS